MDVVMEVIMMTKTLLPLLPADTYIVKNATILNNEVRNTLIKLYQPVIGSIAVNLYFTLWSNLDSCEIIGTEYTHHNLMSNMQLRLDNILEAREKLEAIGLLKTYVKKGSVNNYIYELYSPLSPYEFISNPILNTTLKNNISKSEYEKIIKFFSVPKINLKEYEDITASFKDTFAVTDLAEIKTAEIRNVRSLDIVIDKKVDLNMIFASISSDYLNVKSVTKEIKSLLYKLAFIYNLNEEELTELIKNSVNEKHFIDKNLLRTNCQNYYTFEHQGSTPTLVYKKEPEYLRKQVTSTSKKSKLIYTFESLSPYDFLTGRNKGVRPSKSDLSVLETLLIDYEFTPGVVNVLIDYVLKINNNKLTKNFVLKIADQWKRSNVKTIEEAMSICKNENKVKNRVKKKTTVKEEKPTWFDKDFQENLASAEEISALEARLGGK